MDNSTLPIGARFQYREDPEKPKQWRMIINEESYVNEITQTVWSRELIDRHTLINVILPKENMFDELYQRMQ